MRSLLLCLCLAGLVAGDAPTTTAPLPQGPAPTATPATPPQLGIKVDDVNIDGNGLAITAITTGSTASGMGLTAGDRLLTVNGKAIAKLDDLKAIMAAAKIGDAITVEVQRTVAGKIEKISARGTLSNPKPLDVIIAEQARRINELQREIDQIKAKPRKTLPETLQDLATTIRDLEDQLPNAAEQFRKVYPNGRFKVSIAIDIEENAGAAEKVDVQPRPRPAGSATPATP